MGMINKYGKLWEYEILNIGFNWMQWRKGPRAPRVILLRNYAAMTFSRKIRSWRNRSNFYLNFENTIEIVDKLRLSDPSKKCAIVVNNYANNHPRMHTQLSYNRKCYDFDGFEQKMIKI